MEGWKGESNKGRRTLTNGVAEGRPQEHQGGGEYSRRAGVRFRAQRLGFHTWRWQSARLRSYLYSLELTMGVGASW